MCNCIELTNKELAVYGIQLQQNIVWGNSEMTLSNIIIATERTAKVPRSVKVPVLYASYYPLCGEKYEKETTNV